MSNVKVKINDRYGKLLVIKSVGRNHRGEKLWFLVCDCGGEVTAKSFNLTKGKTKSCGCIKTGPKTEDLIGKRFERLTVVKFSHTGKFRSKWWVCECDCGKIVKVTRANLKKIKSCGCYNVEHKKSLTGSLNPNYNHNLTEHDRIKRRNLPNYNNWCFKVKEKFDFKCQICFNENSKMLNSHHLNSYDSFPEQRFSLENGVCLCEMCHKTFHQLYGYGKNTSQQFLEFKKCQNMK